MILDILWMFLCVSSIIFLILKKKFIRLCFLQLFYLIGVFQFINVSTFGQYTLFSRMNHAEYGRIFTWIAGHVWYCLFFLVLNVLVLGIVLNTEKLKWLTLIDNVQFEMSEVQVRITAIVSGVFLAKSQAFGFLWLEITNRISPYLKDEISFFLMFFVVLLLFVRSFYLALILFLVAYGIADADYFSTNILNKHIDFTALARMDIDMIKMSLSVVPKLVYKSVIALIISGLIFSTIHRKYRSMLLQNRWLCICLVFVAVFASVRHFGVYRACAKILKSSYKVCVYMFTSPQDLLDKLGANDRYVMMNEVETISDKPNNLVVVYCESFDKNFLDEHYFKHETQGLRKLLQSNFKLYENYRSVNGSGWTIGALYSTQTGWPTFFKINGNKIFDNLQNAQVPSYAGVLKKAGYRTMFLSNSKLKFGGTGNLMSLLGYEIVEGAESYSKMTTRWGVHDEALFRKAKEKYKELSGDGRPFHMGLLTVDTHFSSGLPDETMIDKVSCEVKYPSHEFTIATLDHLLKDFVSWIEAQPNADNTVVVIMGDHPMMGNEKNTPIIKKLNSKDGRPVLFMVNREISGYDMNSMMGFYDIPQVMLNLANVKSNVCFSKQLLKGMSPSFVNKNSEIFTVLNRKLFFMPAAQ